MSEVIFFFLRLVLFVGFFFVFGKILLDMMDLIRKEKKLVEKRVNLNDDIYMYFVYLLCYVCRGYLLLFGYSDFLCVCCIRGILDIYM